MQHRSYKWQGSVGAFEDALSAAVAASGGDIEIRQIGGIAKYAVGPDEWRAEWIRITEPPGIRIDLFGPDDTLGEVFDSELKRLVGEADGTPPLVLGGPDATEAQPSAGAGDSIIKNVAGAVSTLHRGALGALVAGGVIVTTSAIVLATARKRGMVRSLGVGGLVLGGALVAGGAALWSIVR